MTDLDLTRITEALTIRPGDHVLIRVDRDSSVEYVQLLIDQLQERLGDKVAVTVVPAEQIAVIRHEETDQ